VASVTAVSAEPQISTLGLGMSPLRAQIGRFAAVGIASTLVHLGLFAALHVAWASQLANLVALAIATVVNTALNRRWTFHVTGGGTWRHQVQSLVVFLLTWGATSGGLALLDLLWATAGTPVKVFALAAATGVSTVARFLAMRFWIFAPGPEPGRVTPEARAESGGGGI
jgi:putative flippase GtrA